VRWKLGVLTQGINVHQMQTFKHATCKKFGRLENTCDINSTMIEQDYIRFIGVGDDFEGM